MTDLKLAALFQLIGTLVVMSDAFIPQAAREAVDGYLRRNSDEYIGTYRNQLRSDWKIFGQFVGAWMVMIYSSVLGKHISNAVIHGERLSATLLMAILGITWVISIRVIKRLSKFSGIYLRLMFIVFVCYPFAKSPRGPIYVLGFAISLIGLIIQFRNS